MTDPASPEGEQLQAPAEPHATELDSSPPRGMPFPVVGIGASSGGLEAFGQLLSALPPNTGMAFVLVQHLDPRQESILTELLAGTATMPVQTVTDGVRLEPNHVYVIPPNTSMELADGALRLSSREPGLHLPIDIFFLSLARVQGPRAIGVVLSGNASDGSAGVRAIKAECGITFAQDEGTARFSGMPRNAVATGAVDYVLPPAAIAQELSTLAKHRFLVARLPGDAQTETLPEGEGELQRIFALLQAATKVDFSRYKPTTIRRRIGRRMMVLRAETIADYARHLKKHPGELRELYRDLLIGVTRFFRDPASFAALSQLLSGVLADRKPGEQPVRVWVPGCATGEEVYSLAICLFEVLQEQHLLVPVQLFGTDISEMALERARLGVYSTIIEEDVKPERLRRFFTRVDRGYQINKAIRESCLFARHDVTKDPPFSNLDLVSCRNLLIYLDERAQRHVLPIFHYALRPTGLLLLGSAESTAAAAELFQPLDKQHRIYARKAARPQLPLKVSVRHSTANPQMALPTSVAPNTMSLQKSLERVIQSRYSPDALLVNRALEIVQFRGDSSPYLEPAPGEASPNLLRMAKESLVLPLRRLVQTAAETGNTARETQLPLEIAGRRESITLEVTPVCGTELEESFYLIVFLREAKAGLHETAAGDAQPVTVDERVTRLQNELDECSAYARTLRQEYEAHAEELQSTNDELGTAKEELQSSNEELTTVNEELQSRNQELNAINSDLKNLLSSVTIPIIMVDSDLRVRRFNPSAGTLLDLKAPDIGRPVGHIRGRIETPRLEQQVKSVIETLHPVAEEVQDTAGCWYAVNIRPYRTVDDRISGAVITFQDIDPLKRGLQAAEAARDYAEGMIETVREPLVVLDADLRVERATRSFYETFTVSRDETEGRFLYDLGNGQWNKPRLRELIGAALFRAEPFHGVEVEHDFPTIGRRTMRLNGRRIAFRQMDQRLLLLSIEDVTARQEIAEIRYQRLFETAKDGIVILDVERETVEDVNPFFLELTGYERGVFIEKSIAEAGRLLGTASLGRVIEDTREAELVRYTDLTLAARDQRQICVDVIGNRYLVGSRPVIQLNVRDNTARQQAAKALDGSEARFRLFVESVRDYALFQTDSSGVILTWNKGAEHLLGWSEQEAVGKPHSLVFTPEDVASGAPEAELQQARASGRAEDERWHLRKDGSRFYASGVLIQLRDEREKLLGYAKIMRDMTSWKEQEGQLRRSIEEKTMLVREIHHRVKNNLQVIISLLSLQAGYNREPEVIAALEETQGRLRAIANIHERLHASEDLADVEFGIYLTNLSRELVKLHSPKPDWITLDLNVKNMVLHIEQAIPLGLIANELIINSIKHGLQNRPGRLSIQLAEGAGETEGERRAEIEITDSGPGFPELLDQARSGSMGLRLVNLLIRQLRGRVEFNSGPGAIVKISFPLAAPQAPVKGDEL